MEKGLLIVISGPAGTGKGTVVKQLLKRNDDIKLSVSATTRNPRPGETHGVEYFFKTREEFEKMISDNAFIEYADYNGNYYGTPKAAVEEQLAMGNNVILEIEVQGAKNARRAMQGVVSVFLAPPSKQILRERLTGRGTETPEVIEQRLSIANGEIEKCIDYDYIVVNDEIELAAERIEAIVKAEKLKVARNADFISELKK